MDVMRTAASALAHWDPKRRQQPRGQRCQGGAATAQLPMILAARHRLMQGKEPSCRRRLSLAGNLLWMLFRKKPTPRAVRAMDVSLILYAEHEYNASTFTARVVASTLADLRLGDHGGHGRAKGRCTAEPTKRILDVLQEVGTADKAETWIRDALARKQRIMGFGHRVYKTGDPRATLLKDLCRRTGDRNRPPGHGGHGRHDRGRGAAGEKSAAESGLARRPAVSLFGPGGRTLYAAFVVSRVTGWAAHVIEQLDNNRLIRPRANYIGPAERAWVPIERRGSDALL